MFDLNEIRSEIQQRKAFLVPAGLAFLYSLFTAYNRWRYQPRNVPIVPGAWWLGPFWNLSLTYRMVRAVLFHEQLELHRGYHEAFGQTFAMKIIMTPWWVLTRDPKNVEYILSKNFDNYPKGSWFTSTLHEVLGEGIFNVDGDLWYHQRKVSSRMFTAKLFKEHIWAVVQQNAGRLQALLESTREGEVVDVFNFLNRFTLDTIGEIGFGKDIGSLADPSSPFLKCFDKSQAISFFRFFNPLWRVCRLIGIGGEKEMDNMMQLLNSYTLEVGQELRNAIADCPSPTKIEGVTKQKNSTNSFVGIFLHDAQKRGEQMSDDFLRDLVLNFLLAGRDTTAQALSWTIFALAQHPEVAQKAREEIVAVCGNRPPTYEELNKLPYVQAVLNEGLRLYPSVPLDMKRAENDDTLPDGTFVPRGSAVFYNIYAMGRDTKLWGPDASEFKPERWLNMDGPVDSYLFPVFNAGPRECLGKRLAQVEMKACLAYLLPSFSFKLAVPPKDVVPDSQITIGMSSGLPCYVEKLT
mmetsp:Transcript_51077/g.110698  ORF Transcript_51077/g.110698 Transcript_51077/m.110698 type:complete len:521 (+) Transcript_51077:98-1660(+)